MSARGERGFTLIELVVTIVISGIVVGFMSLLMVAPVDAYLAHQQRTELNDSANEAMRLLSLDIRRALPRSVRYGSTGSVAALELLRTSQAIRYRSATPPSSPATELNLAADQDFNVFGHFNGVSPPGGLLGRRLIMGYAGGNYPTIDTITPPAATINIATGSDEDAVHVSASVNFPIDSPSKTLFVLDGSVKYLCNTNAGVNTLTRYELYAMTPALVIGVPAGVPAQVVARDVTSCAFNSVAGDATHGDLVLVRLTISRNGETVQVMHQVSVEGFL